MREHAQPSDDPVAETRRRAGTIDRPEEKHQQSEDQNVEPGVLHAQPKVLRQFKDSCAVIVALNCYIGRNPSRFKSRVREQNKNS